MEITLYKNWWLFTLKGVITILFGIAALAIPKQTILVLTMYFGAILLISGAIYIFWLLMNYNRLTNNGKWLLLDGVFDIVMGFLVLSYPELTVKVFIFFIALWLLFIGSIQLFFAFRIKRTVKSSWWLPLINGVITILLAFLVFQRPFESAVAMSYLVGISAILFGFLVIATSLILRNNLQK